MKTFIVTVQAVETYQDGYVSFQLPSFLLSSNVGTGPQDVASAEKHAKILLSAVSRDTIVFHVCAVEI